MESLLKAEVTTRRLLSWKRGGFNRQPSSFLKEHMPSHFKNNVSRQFIRDGKSISPMAITYIRANERSLFLDGSTGVLDVMSELRPLDVTLSTQLFIAGRGKHRWRRFGHKSRKRIIASKIIERDPEALPLFCSETLEHTIVLQWWCVETKELLLERNIESNRRVLCTDNNDEANINVVHGLAKVLGRSYRYDDYQQSPAYGRYRTRRHDST